MDYEPLSPIRSESCSTILLFDFFFTQGDIITSLQSRLDIICDEVDADKDISDDVHGDANEVTSKQHVSQLFLHSLRYVVFIIV